MPASYSFSAAAQELRQARGPAEHERQHAGRQRIERAGVADPRRRRSPRRTRATTSCEVGPEGLSRTRTPSIGSRPLQGGEHQARDDRLGTPS